MISKDHWISMMPGCVCQRVVSVSVTVAVVKSSRFLQSPICSVLSARRAGEETFRLQNHIITLYTNSNRLYNINLHTLDWAGSDLLELFNLTQSTLCSLLTHGTFFARIENEENVHDEQVNSRAIRPPSVKVKAKQLIPAPAQLIFKPKRRFKICFVAGTV